MGGGDQEETVDGDVALPFGRRWYPPGIKREGSGLQIYNSLTRSKVDFVPMDPSGRRVTMYCCGPTVYDAAHLGHARTYIQFDMIRRILREVAGYEVTYVMNVTDVDDKIIKRSAEQQRDPRDLAREWEAKFLDDMQRLNVERPTVMPRVTEYIPEIIAFVEKIVKKKLAYCDNASGEGSVYFDTRAFETAGHDYGKLVPESIGSAELLAEGEGALSVPNTAVKRDARDFALWKQSKPGEIWWDSPWGKGRPGWHIECSAMIDATIGRGGAIDIHGGGIDLRFPHHDNELAQSEAFCGCKQSVHYFAHTGHLNIAGLKMSKSLKNFITIKQALDGVVIKDETEKKETKHEGTRPSTMRIMFAQCHYTKPADYSDSMLAGARAVEKKFKEFFLNVDVALRPLEANSDATQKWTQLEIELEANRLDALAGIREALLDDFNTPVAILILQNLVDHINTYLQTCESKKIPPVSLIIAAAAAVVARYLNILGITDIIDPALERSLTHGPEQNTNLGAVSKQAVLAPVLNALATFRDEVRSAARTNTTTDVLRLCDELRDLVLPDLGVRLEDKPNGPIWKLEDPQVIREDRNRKLAEEADKLKQKQDAAKAKAAKAQAKADAARLSPKDLFTTGERAKLFSQFDELGIPTHDAQGEPISKSQLKKFKKEWDKQKSLHDDFLASAAQP